VRFRQAEVTSFGCAVWRNSARNRLRQTQRGMALWNTASEPAAQFKDDRNNCRALEFLGLDSIRDLQQRVSKVGSIRPFSEETCARIP
jgi:hypothetical protein